MNEREGDQEQSKTPSLYDQTFGRWGLYGSDAVDAVSFARKVSSAYGSGTLDQVVKVLESVPTIFPEDWRAPLGKIRTAGGMGRLTQEQKNLFLELQEMGRKQSPRWIELVIKCGVAFRENSAELPQIRFPN